MKLNELFRINSGEKALIHPEPGTNADFAIKHTVERSFADAKQLHGHRYARYRGIGKVKAQCLLAAACQNMKKIARLRVAFYRLLGLMGRLERVFKAIHREGHPYSNISVQSR
jgi:hypothetical protein